MKVYSIYDQKTGEWSNPFFQNHDVSAIRAFREAVKNEDPNNMLNKYPRDFTLHLIGEWDNETGIIAGKIPQPIVNAESVKSETYDERSNNNGN